MLTVNIPEPDALIEVGAFKSFLNVSVQNWRDVYPDGIYKMYTEHTVQSILSGEQLNASLQAMKIEILEQAAVAVRESCSGMSLTEQEADAVATALSKATDAIRALIVAQ